jgi:hypothetical protein
MKYGEQIIQQVWEKARASGQVDSNLWREDECGAWIRREDYGKTDSEFGWKILNVTPGAPDTPENLRPFHLINGYDLSRHHPRCHVMADRTGLPVFEHTFDPRNREV